MKFGLSNTMYSMLVKARNADRAIELCKTLTTQEIGSGQLVNITATPVQIQPEILPILAEQNIPWDGAEPDSEELEFYKVELLYVLSINVPEPTKVEP